MFRKKENANVDPIKKFIRDTIKSQYEKQIKELHKSGQLL